MKHLERVSVHKWKKGTEDVNAILCRLNGDLKIVSQPPQKIPLYFDTFDRCFELLDSIFF